MRWPICGAEVFGVVCLGTLGCLKLERLVLVIVRGDLVVLGVFTDKHVDANCRTVNLMFFSSCRTSDW